MNKVNFLSKLPNKLAGKEKAVALVYCLVDGDSKKTIASKDLEKQWPKTQFKIGFNACQIYDAKKEGWLESNSGNISITDEGLKYIHLLLDPLKNKKKKMKTGTTLFSSELSGKLKTDFHVEMDDLEYNYGYSGTCTAFLLRKILEKLIYLVFSNNGILDQIEDKNKPGGLVGLEKMIDISSKQKIGNKSIIMPRTAGELRGIKFLGDMSAHNPLANVKMETIIPQLPYIITAYEELARSYK